MDYEGKIAVVGMAGRFPGAGSIEEFWKNLSGGVDSLRFFTDEELKRIVPPDMVEAEGFVKAGYVVDDADKFDAGFFGYSPKQAELMDPQQRVFLECAWSALENAGYAPGKMTESVGVYASAAISSYLLRLTEDFVPWTPTKYFDVLLGNDKDYLATRTCYKLGLKGPGVVVQSACSSSLVAIALACEGLLGYQMDMALAGGVCLTFPQEHGYATIEGDGFMSPDGHCYAFDDRAAGTVQGNGAGVVVLKRLEDAVNDGDTIYAVVRGFAVNNDGADKAGFTAPSLKGQENVIREALLMADVPPSTISYVETHGTGTALGDPIEITALSRAYDDGAPRSGRCLLGSVKTNIGHLNTAAGVASFIKVALSMHRRKLPPSLHYRNPNPKIDFAATPFEVNTHLRDWTAPGNAPLRAGISSFGFGGTNVHMVLEAGPAPEDCASAGGVRVLPLSARSRSALAEMARALKEHMASHPDADVGDAAWTLQAGRRDFAYRTFVLCADAAGAASELGLALDVYGPVKEERTPVAFLLSGEPCDPAVVRELHARFEPFRASFDALASFARERFGADLSACLEAGAADGDVAPAFNCACLLALAALWTQAGVEPAALAGAGAGLAAAAALAGFCSREDALALAMQGTAFAERAAAAIEAVKFRMPQKAVYAASTGAEVGIPEASRREFWAQGACTAQGAAEAALGALHAAGQVLLEVGFDGDASSVVNVAVLCERLRFVKGFKPAGGGEGPDRGLCRMLGALWASGVCESFALVQSGGRRVPLPGYAFERRSFFAAERAPKLQALSPVQASLGAKKAPEDWYYVPAWVRLPLRRRTSSLPEGGWLLYLDRQGLGEMLANKLEASGRAVACVEPGPRFEKIGPGRYALSPGSQEDERALFESLAADGFAPRTVLHFFNVDSILSFERSKHVAYGDLNCIARAHAESFPGQDLAFGIVTRGTFVVTGCEAGMPTKAMLMGPCLVIPQEFKNIRCMVCDLPEGEDRRLAGYLDDFVAELACRDSAHAWTGAVAYRNAGRWHRRFERARLHQPEDGTPAFRRRGVYVITGGLGGLGRLVAERLLKKYGSSVALVGRTRLPEGGAAAGDDAVLARLEALGDLRRISPDVEYFAADVASEGAMRAVFDKVSARWGHIDGVIHAAGVAKFGLIQSDEAVSGNIQAKVAGSYVLCRLCDEFRTGFLLMCSSLAAFGGVAGSVEYAAANSVLDACAEAPSETGVRRISVNWCYWKGVGMGQNYGTGGMDDGVADGFSAEEGLDALERILASDLARVAVCTKDLEALLRSARAGAGPAEKEGRAAKPQDSGARGYARPDIDVPFRAPEGAVEATLADLWQEVLGLASVGADDPFLEVGGDSLTAITLDDRIRSVFSVKLPLNVLFKYDTVAKLAAFLAEDEAKRDEIAGTAEMYQLMKTMSPEEIQEILSAQSKEN